MSKQGVSSPQLFGQKGPHMDRRLQSSLQAASADTQHPHHHLVTYETVDNQSSDGLLKSVTAVELSPQDANMVRLAHDRCHIRAISRVWVAPDTYGHLHPQRARILFRVCPMIHIGCTCQWPNWPTRMSLLMVVIKAPCKARRANQA
jgi:hypothetical protein